MENTPLTMKTPATDAVKLEINEDNTQQEETKKTHQQDTMTKEKTPTAREQTPQQADASLFDPTQKKQSFKFETFTAKKI